MAFVLLSDMSGEIELILFPSTYEETSWLWVTDKVLLIEGKVNALDRDGNITEDVKVNVMSAREIPHEEAIGYTPGKKSIKKLDELKAGTVSKTQKKTYKARRIYIRLPDTKDTDRLQQLKRHTMQYPGNVEVVLVVGPAAAKQAIRIPDKSDDSQECIEMLVSLFGESNVKCE